MANWQKRKSKPIFNQMIYVCYIRCLNWRDSGIPIYYYISISLSLKIQFINVWIYNVYIQCCSVAFRRRVSLRRFQQHQHQHQHQKTHEKENWELWFWNWEWEIANESFYYCHMRFALCFKSLNNTSAAYSNTCLCCSYACAI